MGMYYGGTFTKIQEETGCSNFTTAHCAATALLCCPRSSDTHHAHTKESAHKTRKELPVKNIKTVSIHPKSGTSKTNGACRMALVDVFIPSLSLTLRDLELTYDATDGWAILPPKPKKGLRSVAWVAGSDLEKSMTASASRAYLALNDDEIESLRELYRNADAA